MTPLALWRFFSNSFTFALRTSFSRLTASSSARWSAASSYLMAAAAAPELGLRVNAGGGADSVTEVDKVGTLDDTELR